MSHRLGKSTIIVLTASAEHHASALGLLEAIRSAQLDERCAAGDLVSVRAGDQAHDFAITRRRWLIAESEAALELTLDYPARYGA